MEWRNVKGFPNYIVSDNGDIKNIHTGKPVAIHITPSGYHGVTLWRDGKQHTQRLCRVVAAAFCDGFFEGAEVNHIDEDTLNDSANNLEWVSHVYNMNYGTRTKRAAAKLAIPIVAIANGIETVYESIHEAAKATSGSPGNICACLKGRQKSAYGFLWRYA